MNNKLRGLYVKENELPQEIEIEDKLENLQELVGGYIEYVYLPEDENISIISNEEGKINGMGPNRDIGYDIIYGPFLLVGVDNSTGENISLTDEQIEKFKERFNQNSIDKTYTKVSKILLGIKDDYDI